MTEPNVDTTEPHHDLTEDDIGALETFLNARIAELMERHPHGSAEHIAAAGLSELVRFACWELRDERDEWEDTVAAGRSSESGAAQDLYQRGSSRWRHLLRAAAGWQDHPDFDTVRWKERRFADPEHLARLAVVYAASPPPIQPPYPLRGRP